MPGGYFDIDPPLVANGDIYPSRFVKIDTSAEFKVLQATAGDFAVGISGPGANSPPGLVFMPPIVNPATSADAVAETLLHAKAGQAVQVFGPGAVVPLTAGAAITVGAMLKSDASGQGVTASSTDTALAVALESAAASGVKIEVLVLQTLTSRGRIIDKSLTGTTTTKTLSLADNGKVFLVDVADAVVTLPASAAGYAGFHVTFILTANGLSTGTGLSISPATADAITGNGLTATANKDLILAGSGDRTGDTVTLVCDGTASGGIWWITSVTGTWSKEA